MTDDPTATLTTSDTPLGPLAGTTLTLRAGRSPSGEPRTDRIRRTNKRSKRHVKDRKYARFAEAGVREFETIDLLSE
ncbi:hypothetical protein Aglo03_23200 [Actinokineospora globicatena]|uniref:Uncharacterized protein n=1 Tax=Actinokineospora globicatena TaxID=103729 RepID=A0A9W6V906_9PSEU|nr:hypothetical protein Aglo03_23200 [Actinokineospora globicatena]